LTNRYDKDNFQDYCKMLETYRVPTMIFFLKRKLPAMFPLNALLKHSYLTGGSGSGKTELMKMIAYNLQGKTQQHQNASIVIFDPQGDFSRECLAFKMNKDYSRIVYVDLYVHKELEKHGIIKPKEATFSPVINPFDMDERTIDTVGNMTAQLTKAFEELLKDATITGNMETFLTPCISTLLFREGSSIRDLQRFMQDGNNDDLKQLGKQNPIQDHRNFFMSGGFDMPMYKKTRDALYQKIQHLLNLPNFSRLVVGKSTIDLKQALNSGKVVLFNLAKGELTANTSYAIGKILFAMISGIGYGRVNIEKKQRKNTFVIIDEFQNFTVSYVQNMLEEIRQYKIGFFMAQQYAGQGMENDFLQSILSNTTLKIAGNNDANVFRVLAKSTDITENELKDLPQYSFYVFNRDAKVKREQKYVQINPPNLLGDTSNTQFYLNTTEYKALLQHLVFHSGQYRKDETNINEGVKIAPKKTELVVEPFIPTNDAEKEISNENKPKKEAKLSTPKAQNNTTDTLIPKPKLPL
jgi:Helicase HerA, central domain